jgi:ABC-type phosphate transport system substrate-binding protein
MAESCGEQCGMPLQGGRALFLFLVIIGLFHILSPAWVLADVAVIGNQSLKTTKIDKEMLGRIFTGRMVMVAGISVQPVNTKAGEVSRAVFIREILHKSDDEYIAYWIVRRAIGKGAPPPEMTTVQDMVVFIVSTPGAIGYIDASQVTPGMNVLMRLP